MKNNSKLLTALLIIVTLLFTGSVIAVASQENNDLPHDHEYHVSAFYDGVATVKCSVCDDTYSVTFSDHINERNYEVLDVVPDGIINAKDYAYLLKNYNEFGPVNGFNNGGDSEFEGPGIDL